MIYIVRIKVPTNQDCADLARALVERHWECQYDHTDVRVIARNFPAMLCLPIDIVRFCEELDITTYAISIEKR